MHESRPPSLKSSLKKAALKSLWFLSRPVTTVGRSTYRAGMNLEYLKDWATYPNPEWFNHELDLAFFHEWRRPHFFERGVYASEIVGNKRVLDLCCGDGSLSALFVSPLATSVLAVDFDPSAIEYARAHWGRFPNVEYRVLDIRKLDVAPRSIDVCLWEAAIEHFTQNEMDQIIGSVKRILIEDGIMHGHTIKKQPHLSHHDHEFEFDSLDELASFLKKYFEHVLAWERVHDDRTSFYFRCSDRPISR